MSYTEPPVGGGVPTAPAAPPPDATYSTTSEVGYKKTRQTKENLLKRYCAQIKTSKKWRSDEHYDETWKRLIDLYRGRHFTADEITAEDRIAINISFSTVNVIGPSVSVNHPKISVLPRTEVFQEQAPAVEAAVNYWWKHYQFRPEFRLAVDDFLIIGHGWGKVGYRYVTEQQPLSPQDQADAHAGLIDQADQQAASDPAGAAALPTNDQLAAQVPATTTEVLEDRPFMERVSPFDIFVDPEATSPQDMKWIAQRLVVPLDEAKSNPNYKPSARAALKGNAHSNPRWRDDVDGRSTKEDYNDDVQRVVLWEYYDIRYGLMCVFADKAEAGQFLVEPVEMPYTYGHPYRMLRNYEVPDCFYPIGDLEQIEPIQKELNLTRSAMMNHRKRYARKYFARTDALTEANKTALQSNQDNEIVYIEGDEPFAELVAPVPIESLDPQLYQYSDVIERDADLVSGVTEYQRGSVGETRRTATEASIIQDAVNARSEDKLAIIEDFIAQIAYAVVQLAQTYLTGEQVARFVGPNGAAQWVTFDRDAIAGEFDFEVEAGSTQPRNDTQRRQQALQLANVVQPYVGIPGGIDPSALVQYILREGFGIKNPETFLIPPAPPVVDPATGQQLDPNDPRAQAIMQAQAQQTTDQSKQQQQQGKKNAPAGGQAQTDALLGGQTNATPQGVDPQLLTMLQNLPAQ